jgi:opacity protein-like surface antigen
MTIKGKRTDGGLIIVQDTRDFNKANTQLGKIVHLGPLSYRNRDTGELWKEGVWARPGDFVRIPKWGGDRFERKIPGSEETAAQTARSWTGGLNWYATNTVKVQSNYEYTSFDRGAAGTGNRPIERAILTRVQLAF